MNLLNEFSIIENNVLYTTVIHENLEYFKMNMFNDNIRLTILDKLSQEINELLYDFDKFKKFISLSDLTTLAFLHKDIEDFIENSYKSLSYT